MMLSWMNWVRIVGGYQSGRCYWTGRSGFAIVQQNPVEYENHSLNKRVGYPSDQNSLNQGAMHGPSYTQIQKYPRNENSSFN